MTTRRTEPFFTVPKAALSIIEQRSEGRATAHCKSVFLALRWLANNHSCPEGPLTISINEIAAKVPCSYRKTSDSLKRLESYGVITIGRNVDQAGDRAPSSYGFGTACLTSGTACLRLGTKSTRKRADSIKEQKESKESWEQSATPQLGEGTSKPNSPNPILRFLVGLGGGDPAQATKSAWGAAAKARKEILSVFPALTETELSRRVGNYRRHWPQASISASALAKHWAKCDKGPEVEGHRAEPILRKVAL